MHCAERWHHAVTEACTGRSARRGTVFATDLCVMTMTTVDQLMTRAVESLQIGDTLDIAKTIMRLGRIRHMPVVDGDGTLIGLITHRDIMKAWVGHSDPVREDVDEISKEIPVDMMMQTDVKTVAPDTTALDAAETITLHKYGCLPVVENGKLVGILTEADFVKFAVEFFRREAEQRAR